MKKHLRISQILVYYDLPEVMLAKDTVGTNYVCLLVENQDDEYKYISIAISEDRLFGLLNDKVDLRDLYVNPEIREYYSFGSLETEVEALLMDADELQEEYLPEYGFEFGKQIESEKIIFHEALRYENAVFHLGVADKENNKSIEADILSSVVKYFQSMIENCYKKTVRKIKFDKNENKLDLFNPQNYGLRAFSSSNASFNLHFYSKANTDLFGNSTIEKGLQKLDEITNHAAEDADIISALLSVSGHAVSALKNLTKKVLMDDIVVKYKWYAPNQSAIHSRSIDKLTAERLFNIINTREDFETEIKIFKGYFKQVDVKKGTWRIFNEADQHEYAGKAQTELLYGVTVEEVEYEIICQEIIQEFAVSDKDKITYVLQTINID